MFSKIYIEEEARNHPRAAQILKRYADKEIISCNHYGEIFNKKNQNFRLQKQNPALIIALKKGAKVLEAPEGFGIGSLQNYYFSHMLNCLYDCRYCFLQGMYNSAYYIWFINYEDFYEEIESLDKTPGAKYFFSGYDCDSMALESLTSFGQEFIPFFQKLKNSYLELRTKSVNVAMLKKMTPSDNIITAFSFTPDEISKNIEHKVAPVRSRIKALANISAAGWPVGLRLDPLIYQENYQELYSDLIKGIFENISLDKLHSVSVGPLRFPKKMHEKIYKLYPKEEFLSKDLEQRGKLISYKEEIEIEMQAFIMKQLENYTDKNKVFSCANF